MGNHEFVLKECYKKYLHREPDPEGFAYYLSLLETGKINEKQLSEQFVNSPEYKIIQLTLQYEQESKTKIQINDKTFFVDPSNHASFWAQLQIGRWEPYTFKIFDTFLDFNHSYIDIGSWIGPTVLYGCQKAKKCYALEPDPIAYKYLENNIKLNPNLTSRIILSNKCIMDSCGTTYLTSKGAGGDSMSSTVFEKSSKSWEIQATTLQQFILDHSIHDCNFIKIDIEGSEFSVLPNVLEFLKERKPTLYLSLHPPLITNPKKSMEEIYDVIAMYNFSYDEQLCEIKQDSILNEDKLNKFFEIIVSEKQLY